ncbi:MAG TPA: hypothetical protein VKX45_13240 [Bryobacteraceae bacterium]|jgi:hypothetical protein|nr:hypothetical protein [Bryobacteraceae bacterium]
MRRLPYTCILPALLLSGAGLVLPRAAQAQTACSNAFLSGTYAANVSSASFLSVLAALNGTAALATAATPASSGDTGTNAPAAGGNVNSGQEFFGSGAGKVNTASTPSTTLTGNGFLNNPMSIGGANPSTSVFTFDGMGNILGQPVGTVPVQAGTYSVNSDCTATISLATGQKFNAVVAGDGSQVLFLENNAGQGGAVGTLRRTSAACLARTGQPQTFAFSFFGTQASPATTGTGVTLAPSSALGSLQLNGAGNFTLTEWVYQNGATTPVTESGTYSVDANCGVTLNFPGGAGSAASGFAVPATFHASLGTNATGTPAMTTPMGLLVINPESFTTVNAIAVAQ